MQRDLRLIRLILLAFESHCDDSEPKIEIEGVSQSEIDYHLRLMVEADLLRFEPREQRFAPHAGHQLTWSGHEFLDAARDANIWAKTMTKIEKFKGFTWQIVQQTLVKILVEKLG